MRVISQQPNTDDVSLTDVTIDSWAETTPNDLIAKIHSAVSGDPALTDVGIDGTARYVVITTSQPRRLVHLLCNPENESHLQELGALLKQYFHV